MTDFGPFDHDNSDDDSFCDKITHADYLNNGTNDLDHDGHIDAGEAAYYFDQQEEINKPPFPDEPEEDDDSDSSDSDDFDSDFGSDDGDF